jgi:CRP-like cAMP-binding protein
MDELKQLLRDESPFKISDELLDIFLGKMSEVRLRNHEVLIPYGRLDANMYVQKEGITRYVYFDGTTERTYGFATPGTIMISYHSFYDRQPSFFQLESCGESVVMRISKSDFDEMMKESHEFSQWMWSLSLGQLYSNELKVSVINGQAKERFVSLVKNRPEIIARVPSQTIASYLGVTPSYLSRLRRKLLRDK